jgi:uncharacterized membrane protein
MRLFKLCALFVLTIAFSSSFPTVAYAQEEISTEVFEAEVVEILESKQIELPDNQFQTVEQIKLRATGGALEGEHIVVSNTSVVEGVRQYKQGDRVLVTQYENTQGSSFFEINEHIRTAPLGWLFAIFVLLSLVVAKKWGVLSLLGMAFSFLIIFTLLLPLIQKGWDPALTALLSAAIIVPVTFYLSHGFSKKTHIAIVGTTISLIVTVILAAIFIKVANLTGLASEEALFLYAQQAGAVNFKGILLAGVIIASLGVLDDITISQSAIVTQLKEANRKLKFAALYKQAMSIGKDHIASMVNTLILVYAGASLPLLLLFVGNPQPVHLVVNYEIISEEIMRMLVGSIGLILAVPVTTALAAFVFSMKERN